MESGAASPARDSQGGEASETASQRLRDGAICGATALFGATPHSTQARSATKRFAAPDGISAHGSECEAIVSSSTGQISPLSRRKWDTGIPMGFGVTIRGRNYKIIKVG
jgi:hypothetical protein